MLLIQPLTRFRATAPKTEDGQIGEARILLDEPHRLYRPGEIIRGRVDGVFDPSVDVNVVLDGRVKTKVCQNHSIKYVGHRARAPLLYELHSIQGDRSFAVKLPLKTSTDLDRHEELTTRYWDHTWPQSPAFTNELEHPLPPTVDISPRERGVRSEGYVSYQLKVVARRKGVKTDRARLTLSKCPVRLTTPNTPVAELQRLRAEEVPARANKTLALGASRFSRRLSTMSDNTDTSGPEIQVETSHYAAAGEPICIKVSIKHEAFQAPTKVALESLQSELVAKQHVRTNGGQLLNKEDMWKTTVFTETKAPKQAFVLAADGLYEPQTIQVQIPGDTVPTFRTLNLSRSYDLSCKLEISVASKRQSMECMLPIMLLSGIEAEGEVNETLFD